MDTRDKAGQTMIPIFVVKNFITKAAAGQNNFHFWPTILLDWMLI